MSCTDSKQNKKSKDVKIFNMITDDVRSQLEILDLENEETEDVEVYNMISDDVRSRLGVLDLEDE